VAGVNCVTNYGTELITALSYCDTVRHAIGVAVVRYGGVMTFLILMVGFAADRQAVRGRVAEADMPAIILVGHGATITRAGQHT
jgi:hypothetical protein